MFKTKYTPSKPETKKLTFDYVKNNPGVYQEYEDTIDVGPTLINVKGNIFYVWHGNFEPAATKWEDSIFKKYDGSFTLTVDNN